MNEHFTVVASTLQEAKKKAQELYGANCMILNHRSTIKGGVLGFGGKEMVEVVGVVLDKPPQAGNETRRTNDAEALQRNLQEMKDRFVGPSGAGRAAPQAPLEDKLDRILNEIQTLKRSSQAGERTDHPNERHLMRILGENDFPDTYITELIQDLRNKLTRNRWESLYEVQEAALNYIAKTITLSPSKDVDRPRVIVLVGPTGVGKTTTIGKLAFFLAEYQNKVPRKRVTLVNLDGKRVQAQATLFKYGEYLRMPVHHCTQVDEFERAIALSAESHYVLVDTAGYNPKNFAELAETRQFLEVIKERYETLLTLSAVTKTQDLETIIENYSMFNAKDVIVTKLDETSGIGNVISVLWEHGKNVRYLTTGQNVPLDFATATKAELMKNLVGFTENLFKEFLKELENG